MRDGQPDMVGADLAAANYDWERHTPNYTRWAEINKQVLESLAKLERDFAHLRDDQAQ
jgi:hypothetical protein